ncbi:MAG: AAA family ATPase [Candidatus Zixiibacteriota bacterium]
MPEKLSVVLVDADKSVRKTLRDLLDQQGNLEVACVAKGQDEAFPAIRASKPHVLILELPKDSDKTLKWIERMKLEFPDISIFVSSADKSPDLVISAMRAGVQEFLSRPINSDELKKAINKVFKTREQTRAQAPTRGKVISVFSKKGGLGVTTLAVNLGSALARVAENKAALIDLDLQLGDVTSFLNLSPEYSILDVLDEDGGVDAVKLQSCMTRHESGVFVLSEPKNPADSENVSSSQINQILRHLRSTFSYVLVDTPHNFDSKTLEVFELSDHIIVVVVPNVSSIRAARRTLGVFKQLGFLRDKVKVVVNRVGKKDSVRVDDVEKTLRYPVSWVVPNNYPVAIDAVNSGVPLVNHKGDSNLAKSILELANDIPEWSRSLYVELKD